MTIDEIDKYEVIKINRAQLNNAAYNPRKINALNKNNLKKSIKEYGLLQPIIWNEKTGNIVGGHQRIEQIDALIKKSDYELKVTKISVSEEEEVKINILLNNKALMGEYDEIKLAEINLDYPEIDFQKDLCFDKYDIDIIFAGSETIHDIYNEKQQEQVSEIEKLKELDTLKAAKRAYRENKAEENGEGTTRQTQEKDNLVSFVFNNNSEKQEFMEKIKEPKTGRYVAATKLYSISEGHYIL